MRELVPLRYAHGDPSVHTFAGWSPRLARGRSSGVSSEASPESRSAGACPGGSPAPSDGMRVRPRLCARGLAGTFARPGGTAARLEGTRALPLRGSPRGSATPAAELRLRPFAAGPASRRSGLAASEASFGARPASEPTTIATWLILPVVICLSQRLSHACLSMRGLNTLKLRMAHYISNNFFDGPLATRIPVENLELIRARRPDPREGLQLLDTRPTAFGDPR